ncbi:MULTISPECIES: hypothetical protein [unclassified Nitrobacter]|uniref:hypothetical protein n=1 Tax=unclassified Nitrobacter TaxID=2620411 RepID=UPI00092836D4|nr:MULTISPECIES: hypothetical protein [unclassified Nitrobacter]MBN9146838.1 hypothetical protein [Nitrobacter sp.]OJU99900.1 MAG: hypothetical protein BGO16_15105 [Nitrobacter sp. 62-23]
MDKPNKGYDYRRYRNLLAEATDESKRLAFIDLLIEEGARDQLTRERISQLGLTTRPAERSRVRA